MPISVNSNEHWPQDLQDQLNGQTGFYGITGNGKLPSGVTPGSLASYQDENAVTFHFADNSRNFTPGVRIPKTLTFFTGITRSSGAPSTTELPAAGNFGWHQNTSTGDYYWAYNDAGTVVLPAHLNQPGGTLHPEVTPDVDDGLGNITPGVNGFMGSADKAILDAATTSTTASTLVLRSAARAINCGSLQVFGVKVVGAQLTNPGIFIGTGGSGNDGPARAKINSILTILSDHGLIT